MKLLKSAYPGYSTTMALLQLKSAYHWYSTIAEHYQFINVQGHAKDAWKYLSEVVALALAALVVN